jgi:hypothetical protein
VPIRHAPPAKARTAAEDPVDHTDEWVETSLARPLFSRDRRPTVVAAKAGETVISSMPRLTGVLVSPLGRSAIFAGPDGGKPMVISEGSSLGPYLIKSIAPGHVTVSGPEGERDLEPSFDANARRAVAEAPQPAQPRPQVLNFRPGNQFQRALSTIENAKPQQRNETDQ